MEHQQVDLSTGGMVAVLLGAGFECPTDYRYHPQVQILDSAHVDATGVAKMMPDNTRIAITTRNVPPPTFAAFKQWCQRHRIAYLPRSTPGAIGEELKRLLSHKPVTDVEPAPRRELPVAKIGDAAVVTVEKEPTKRIAPRGAIQQLMEEADLTRGTAEEARRLLTLARARGLQTTLASVEQAIRIRKRKRGVGDIPLSATPESRRLGVLAAFDKAIDAMQEARKYVEEVDAQIVERDKTIATLRAKLELVQEAFKGLDD